MMTSNLNEVSKKMDRLINRLTSTTLKQALYLALQVVGFKAVSKYMVQTGGVGEAARASVGSRLTIRTGRLSGSLVAAPRFSVSELPSLAQMQMGGMKATTISRMGGEPEWIHEVKRSGLTFIAIKGSKVPYAAIQEEGGTTSAHTILPVRKKVLHWDGIFAKSVQHPGSSIPARPYLAPAVKDSQKDIMNILERTIIHQGRVHDF